MLVQGILLAGLLTIVVAALGPWTAVPKPDRAPPDPVPPVTPAEAAVWGVYTALGDSFSAGIGALADRETASRPGCGRSELSYAPLIVTEFLFRGGNRFLACSGARVASLFRRYGGQGPQVDGVDGRASLITLTIGGNDLGYAGVLKNCVTSVLWSDSCREQQPEILARIDVLRADLARLLGELHRKAPRARIVVMGYPRLFPERPSGSVDFVGADEQLWLNEMTRRANEVIRQTVRGVDEEIVAARDGGSAEFADAFTAFDGGEAGTASPYLHALNVDFPVNVDPRSFHPNEAGNRRLAEVVRAQVHAGPGRPLAQPYCLITPRRKDADSRGS
ncbi:SGNH/GDSL hydrolase family protein [Rhizohabitans arisaemae]|uniref:SGNH/GDSL hydrolase family protein n=1 Tax=Rhizohabitans arisaemae TaxID=2720610 RepID=UPI0024B128F9|nr:SGNH/GDSL hydrolase family protein [Rhizohabitans arisaemae]